MQQTITNSKRTLIVAIVLSAAFVSILNQTLLMIAMPPIMADFQIDASAAQWLTTIYLLTNGILIPITAYLIGRFSNRALLLTALSLFTVGTLIGAFAPNYPVLLGARVIQAAGAGIIMPLMQTIILTLYPKEQRGSVMGIAGLVTGFAPAVGPTLAGWLLTYFTWRHLFYTVLPVALVVILLVFVFMKNVTPKQERQFDMLSIVYSTFGWGGLLYGFSMVGSVGFTSWYVLISLAVGIVALFMFIRRQFKLPTPILEFRVFQSKVFTISTLLSVLVYALMIGTQILLTFYVQNVRELSALQTGIILLPGALLMGFMSPVTGKIFDKFGGRGLALYGFTSITFALAVYMFLSVTTPIWIIAILFAFISLGIAMIMMPLTTAGMNALPGHLMPHGTAVNSTLRMVGGAIVTALLVTAMSGTMSYLDDVSADAMLIGIRVAFVIATILSVLGLALSFMLKENKRNS
ncbi:MDR family MFS transporter [Solibacillus sp. FSL K6-1523]|uniref:MDR family MFS transporter n=1 Tax=Solibacillus sp. FSL K6-1523 TaxID=2921471 RepID=UPI0030FB75FD